MKTFIIAAVLISSFVFTPRVADASIWTNFWSYFTRGSSSTSSTPAPLPPIMKAGDKIVPAAPFTTPLTVISPNGGETFQRLSTYTISWNAFKSMPVTIYRVDSAGNSTVISQNVVSKAGLNTMTWNIGAAGTTGAPASGSYRIKICSSQDCSVSDTSNGSFSVAPVATRQAAPIPPATITAPVRAPQAVTASPSPTVTLPPIVMPSEPSTGRFTSPVGGESFTVGGSAFLKHFGGATGDKVRIDLVNVSTSQIINIRSGEPLNSTYESTVFFEIPATVPPGSYYARMVRLSDSRILNSSAPFTIKAKAVGISVIRPYINEVYTAGDKMTIEFSPINFPNGTLFEARLAKREVAVNSSIDDVSTISASIPVTNILTWTIPTTLQARNNYVIVICPIGGGKDECGHSPVFEVKAAPSTNPSSLPVSMSGTPNAAAAVFYSIGDLVDSMF